MIVPPDSADEDGVELKWEEIDASVKGFPYEYQLKLQAQQVKTEHEDEPILALVPMLCHRVKVQRFVHRAIITHNIYIHS